ncbi:gelsolin-like [Pollicipes pollicipes]|uniref:gelsolin-like n=1 Tax=Pollicipes pollicipes TaxID=41117 RepID=UPI001884F194|nr:gelsolin-like [Pollicipes pollicipes]
MASTDPAFACVIPNTPAFVVCGLRHVEDSFTPRMFHVKGKRRAVISQTPEVSWKHVNDGDVFVIDAERFVFVWCGRTANGLEKIQAAYLAQSLARRGRARRVVIVASGEERSLTGDERVALDALLPLTERVIRETDEALLGSAPQRRPAEEVSLWLCTEDGGQVSLQLEKTGGLVQGDLSPDHVYVVDAGSVVWLWVSRRAVKEQRAEDLRPAEAYLAQTDRSADVPLCRVVDGSEPAEFRSLFAAWVDDDDLVSPGRVIKPVLTKFDAAMLHNNSALAARTQMVDDGSGYKDVWRVEGSELAPLPVRDHGTFLSSDCYVVQYCYRVAGRERYIVYYWLGTASDEEARAVASQKAAELDGKVGGRAVLVRIVQSREPPHFVAMFGGVIVVRDGGAAAAAGDAEAYGEARSATEADDRALGDAYLLQIASVGPHGARACEVPRCAASLHSNDAFVLSTSACVFAWCGRGSGEQEREAARAVAHQLDPHPVVVDEAEEPAPFWEALGGRGEYSHEPRAASRPRMPPRLFHCSSPLGRFRVEEVVDFDQADLGEDDVMLLDTWDAVFVWLSVRANRAERRRSETVALEYLRSDPAGRGTDTPVYRVHQQAEPPIFTGCFAEWDADFWAAQPTWPADAGESLPVFPLEALRARRPPEGVNPARREEYLAPEDFKDAFGMTREEFQRLPAWKKAQKKREASLF